MQTSAPERAGMDAKRLERIDAYMQEAVQNDRLPGILTLVQRRDNIVQLGSYGKMDIEAGRAMETDALFRIYSMTKPITSVAILLLVEAGKLSLNDPVAKYIPAFKQTKVYAGMDGGAMTLTAQQPEMTVYHLLTHTAGLSYGFFESPVDEQYRRVMPALFERNQPLSTVIEQIAELPLLCQPGAGWNYSVATDVLAYLVQVIAEMPVADFFRTQIFEPLGMADTDFYVPASRAERLAQIYKSADLYDPVPIPPHEVGLLRDVTTPTQSPSGGGGLVSTLADYLAFCNCLLHKGAYEGGRLLGHKTWELMTANHIPAALMPIRMGDYAMDHGFGLGFSVTTALGGTRKLGSVGNFGWGGAANTFFSIDPSEDLILLMMTQYLPVAPYPVAERFQNLVYQAIND